MEAPDDTRAFKPANCRKRVVTPEMLRAYWFGGPQVPFWNYDPSKLQVGVKIEYFIAKRGASPLSLATRADWLS